MAGARIRLASAGGIALQCAGGVGVIRLCGCGDALCACCGTGNQCLLWSVQDDTDAADAVAAGVDPGDADAYVAATPYLDRLNGWSLLGNGWDVVTEFLDETIQEYWADDGAGGVVVETATTRLQFTRTVRFRLAPIDATSKQLIDAFGAPTGADGWQVYHVEGPPTIPLAVNKYTDNGAGGYTQGACVVVWMDIGPYNGERRATDTGADGVGDLVLTVVDGVADDFYPGFYPQNALIGEHPPFRRQEWVFDSVEPTYISPLPCDGIVWTGFAEGGQRPPVRESVVVGQPFDWEGPGGDYWLDRLGYWRVGASQTVSGDWESDTLADAEHVCTHTVTHGDDCVSDLVDGWTVTRAGFPTITTDRRRRVRHALTRMSPCAGYALLPDNDCVPVSWDNRIGRECNNPSNTVVYDPATRPSPPEDWPTFLHTADGDIERHYTATDEPSPLDAETVTWSEDPCPDPGTGNRIAYLCDPDLPDPRGDRPASVVYAVNPVVGAGNGRVEKANFYPNPACPAKLCTEIVQYNPTTEVSTDPATSGVSHVAGTPCLSPIVATACQDCGGPVIIIRPEGESGGESGGESMGMMAMGDPMAAQMRHFGGGCCG